MIKLISVIIILFLPQTIRAAVVLQYHHIDTKTPNSTSTSPQLFIQHMKHLKDNNYTVISLNDLVLKVKTNSLGDEKLVAITFDDGYESVYTHAFPTLKKYQFPFTLFVDTAAIEAKRRGHVSWKQLREMKNNKATIANHTHNHQHLIRRDETNDEWKIRITNEINLAQSILAKRLTQDIKLLSYPYGEFDSKTLEVVSQLGYVSFGQHSGAIGSESNLQRLPRFSASNRFGQFPQFINKLQSTEFKNIRFEPKFGVLTPEKKNPPALYIYGNLNNLNTISCYSNTGEALIKLESKNNTLIFKATKPFLTRRFRYNCTAPEPDRKRFRWVSIPWINSSISEK